MRRIIGISALGLLALVVGCAGGQKPAVVGVEVGNTAPDLDGVDFNGRPIHLRDYRGKVVVVDFWATWCGPCRQLIPHEKKLYERMAGKPFEMIAVSADRSRSALGDYIETEQLKWINIFDGSNGPLVQQWQIEYFPTIFVIDAKGVIRYKDVREKSLDRAVDALLAEMGK